MKKSTITGRPGWASVPAVRNGHIYEIKSTYILQPGPASLTEGVRQIHELLCTSMKIERNPALRPDERVDPDAGSALGQT